MRKKEDKVNSTTQHVVAFKQVRAAYDSSTAQVDELLYIVSWTAPRLLLKTSYHSPSVPTSNLMLLLVLLSHWPLPQVTLEEALDDRRLTLQVDACGIITKVTSSVPLYSC
jgi:hypothetical protein